MLRYEASDPLRIALVSEHASPLADVGEVDAGGQNVHVAELAAGLTELGHEVVVYTRKDRPGQADRVITPAGYQVAQLAAGPQRRLAKDELWPHMAEFADGLTSCFDLDRPDVAHAHFWMSGWATRQAAWSHGSPFLVTFHALGVVKRRYQGAADTSPADRVAVEAELARQADGVVATCRDEVSELLGIGADVTRISTVPCGVDLDLFEPGRPTRAADREGRLRLVSVGRLVPARDSRPSSSRSPGCRGPSC